MTVTIFPSLTLAGNRSAPASAERDLAIDIDLGVVVVRLGGEIDFSDVPALTSALAPLRAHRPHPRRGTVVLDLAAVTFMDTRSLTELLNLRPDGARHGWIIRLAGAQPNVQRLLDHAVRAGCYEPDPPDPEDPADLPLSA